MENVSILRQDGTSPNPNATSSYTIHCHPYTTLPPLESHVRPEFAIFALGKILREDRERTLEKRVQLFDDNPILHEVVLLHKMWCTYAKSPQAFQRTCLKDPTYVNTSTQHSVHVVAGYTVKNRAGTPPKRIQKAVFKPNPTTVTTKRRRSASDNSDEDQDKPRKRLRLESTEDPTSQSESNPGSLQRLDSVRTAAATATPIVTATAPPPKLTSSWKCSTNALPSAVSRCMA